MPIFKRRPATIASSVRIRGDVSCANDLLIEGSVTGSVALDQGRLTVGRAGQATATLIAEVVHVDGLVVGDVIGARLVVVTRTGSVQGNIIGPRIVLEPGAKISGGIDMSGQKRLTTARTD